MFTLQYGRQLNPLRLTALHVAVDPAHARELAERWARVRIPVPLEVVDCPDRNLPAYAQSAIAELRRPNTEVTVLRTRRSYARFWHRVLHDRSSPSGQLRPAARQPASSAARRRRLT